MKSSATIFRAGLLGSVFMLLVFLLLAGCAPIPYQGNYDSYTEVIIIHEPAPYPIPHPYPRREPVYEPPRQPEAVRNTPLTRDAALGNHESRTRTQDGAAGRTVARSPRHR